MIFYVFIKRDYLYRELSFLSTACSTSSRALLEAVNEVYEPEWGGKELLTVNSQSVELLWNDFAHRLAEQVLIPLNTYQVCDVMW